MKLLFIIEPKIRNRSGSCKMSPSEEKRNNAGTNKTEEDQNSINHSNDINNNNNGCIVQLMCKLFSESFEY
jgi:hypothetical protein